MRSSPIDVRQYNIRDEQWSSIISKVRSVMLPYQWEALNDRIPGAAPSHCIHNFLIAAGKAEGKFEGFPFQDSDLYKWLEAVAYSLATHPDKALEAEADDAVDLICSVQAKDGYLDTYYLIGRVEKRFTDLTNNHELYCAGHMLEAALVYAQTTGKQKFLDAAMRYVHYISEAINEKPGCLPGYPGHEVLEMALLRLYRWNHSEEALHYAQYLLRQRGQKPSYFLEECKREGRKAPWGEGPLGLRYFQADCPVTEQEEAEGHAVRAMYLYSAMADLCALTEDPAMSAAITRLWDNLIQRKLYITGCIGSSPYGEAFTFDYDLPSDTVYGETCASIGMVFFAQRMLYRQAKGEYGDIIEQTLYNAIMAGMDENATAFFYTNPLEVWPEACQYDANKSHIKPVRQPWFGCACCPPNLARLLCSLGTYVITDSEDTLLIHQYITGDVILPNAMLAIETGLPWNGSTRIHVQKLAKKLLLRVPGWSGDAQYTLNGESIAPVITDGYACIERTWQEGDLLELHYALSPRMMQSRTEVRETFRKLAVMRGPIVYCAEEADNGAELHELCISPNAEIIEKPQASGEVYLEVKGWRRHNAGNSLYQPVTEAQYIPAAVKLIPYYHWGNRGKGEMYVWLNER